MKIHDVLLISMFSATNSIVHARRNLRYRSNVSGQKSLQSAIRATGHYSLKYCDCATDAAACRMVSGRCQSSANCLRGDAYSHTFGILSYFPSAALRCRRQSQPT